MSLRRKFVVALIGTLSAGMQCERALADDLPPVEVSLTPRVWYLFEDRQLFETHEASVQVGTGTNTTLRSQTSDQPKTVMAGGTIGLRFASLPETTFNLTELHGYSRFGSLQTDLDLTGAGGGINSISTAYSRDDVEFLAQTRISEQLSWIAGVRAELSNFDETVNAVSVTAPSVLTPASPNPRQQNVSYNFYSVKGGVGYSVPLSDDGRHQLFGNFLGVLGINDVEATHFNTAVSNAGALIFSNSGFTSARIGSDLAFGYQYTISQNLSIDLRYRILASYLFDGPSSNPIFGKVKNTFYLQHGPMLGATWHF